MYSLQTHIVGKYLIIALPGKTLAEARLALE